MKSYTDIEQSKKLTEILPIETADMYFHPYPNDEDWYDIPNFGEADKKFNQLPCWSLSALLNVIPYASLEEYNGCWGCNSYNKEKHAHVFGKITDNPVDACYDMIIKLHELNSL